VNVWCISSRGNSRNTKSLSSDESAASLPGPVKGVTRACSLTKSGSKSWVFEVLSQEKRWAELSWQATKSWEARIQDLVVVANPTALGLTSSLGLSQGGPDQRLDIWGGSTAELKRAQCDGKSDVQYHVDF
jgi:hypothetical protein